MENFTQVPLNLPETRVLQVGRAAQGHWLIRVESTKPGTTCRRCGRESTNVHGDDEPIRLRHLPLFEVPVYVEIRPKRYRCRFCRGSPTTSERCSWYDAKNSNTRPYEEWLLRLLINSTEVDTARKLGITQDVVDGVLERWIARQVNWEEVRALRTLRIDEIALKKGHRDFVVLITTPTVEQCGCTRGRQCGKTRSTGRQARKANAELRRPGRTQKLVNHSELQGSTKLENMHRPGSPAAYR